MYEFINKRLVYPQSALNDSIEGRVTVRFLVRETGDLDKITLIRGIHPECDSLALQIVRAMPRWNPGSMHGSAKKEDIWFTLPITFRLPYKMVDGEKVFVTPDIFASFPGGESELYNFINANKKYPVCTCELPQGRVTVRFIVTKEGKITNPVILRNLHPDMDKEALRVISLMPDWIPAKQGDENVNSYFTMPVVFRLRN